MVELLYSVTDDDEVVGPIERDRAHADGVLHRSGIVLLARSNGQVLVQHRSPTKATFPGRVDASAAFHVTYGEAYELAAVRELLEETGIRAAVAPAGKFVHHDPPEHQVVAVFTSESDDLPRIDAAESTGYEFLSPEEVEAIVRAGPVTPWLRRGWPLARPLLRAGRKPPTAAGP